MDNMMLYYLVNGRGQITQGPFRGTIQQAYHANQRHAENKTGYMWLAEHIVQKQVALAQVTGYYKEITACYLPAVEGEDVFEVAGFGVV